MSFCWEIPGCDDEMSGRCPHQTLCPFECGFAKCYRLAHHQVGVMEVLDYPDTDRSVCRKEVCTLCRFFLENGPKLESETKEAVHE